MANTMRWYALLSCMVALSYAYSSAKSSQESPIEQQKQDIVESGYNVSADILRTVYKNNNVIFSPFSIRLAMALVHLGANGETRDELSQLLGFGKRAEKIQRAHEILSEILKEVKNLTNINIIDETNVTDIGNANGVFVQKGLKLLLPYKRNVQSLYKGLVANVDFARHPSNATVKINQFVSKNTNGRIPKLFADTLDSQIRILIAACLYFKSSWDEPFTKSLTKEGNFDTGFGNTSVKFMYRTDNVPYVDIRSLKIEAISLSYIGNEASIFFVLPYRGQTLDSVVGSLNGDVLRQIVRKCESTYVELKVPRMKYKWSEDVDHVLQKLGVRQLFGAGAQLNNILHSRSRNATLKVSKVSHAAEIEINENGTEASAVTVVKIVTKMGGFNDDEPIHFHLDRPFLMFVHHRSTQTILFVGTVHNPIVDAAG